MSEEFNNTDVALQLALAAKNISKSGTASDRRKSEIEEGFKKEDLEMNERLAEEKRLSEEKTERARQRAVERDIEYGEAYRRRFLSEESTRRERTLLQRQAKNTEMLTEQKENSERIISEYAEKERHEAQMRRERAERLFALAEQAGAAENSTVLNYDKSDIDRDPSLFERNDADTAAQEKQNAPSGFAEEQSTNAAQAQSVPSEQMNTSSDIERTVISIPATILFDGKNLKALAQEPEKTLEIPINVEADIAKTLLSTQEQTEAGGVQYMRDAQEHARKENYEEPDLSLDMLELNTSNDDESEILYERRREMRIDEQQGAELDEYERYLASSSVLSEPVQAEQPDGSEDGADALLQEKHEASLDYHESIVEDGRLEHLNKRQFRKKERAFLKQDYENSEEQRRLRKKIRNSVYKDTVICTVKILEIQKLRIEGCEEVLLAAVAAELASKVRKYRRICISYVKEYNKIAASYKKLTRKALSLIPADLPDRAVEKKEVINLPTVYCEEESMAAEEAPRVEKKEIEKEYLSFLSEYQKGKKAEGGAVSDTSDDLDSSRGRAQEMSAADVELIRARYNYIELVLVDKWQTLLYRYTTSDMRNPREEALVEKRLSSLKKNLKRAEKLEAADNKRYFRIQVGALENRRPKRCNKAKLDSLKLRLEQLLFERDAINERLTALYRGSVGGRTHLEKKISSVVLKERKRTYKSQRRLAKKIMSLHTPQQTKEKVYDLMNRRTELCASIAEIDYRLERVRLDSAAKRELKRKRRDMIAEIKEIKRNIAFLMRRAERQDDGYRADRHWVIWLVGLVVFAAAATLYYFYFDAVNGFFWRLFVKGA